jgi:toluene monooxygenase electron transfer component
MSADYTIRLQPSGLEYRCAPDDTVLRAGLRAGIGLAYECNVGGCGTCKFDLIEGEVENLWEEAPGLNPRDKQRGRRLACQSRPRGDCVIKPVLTGDYYAPVYQPRRFEARLAGVRDLTHDIREFRFEDSRPAQFRAGEYALFSLPGVAGPRAYSMSNVANAQGHWDFIVRQVPNGSGTRVLFDDLGVGDTLEIDGPYGLAYLRTDVLRHIICIGGGSGLAPMLSIARGFASEPALQDVHLKFFYGARQPRDLCGEAELRTLPGFGERIQFIPALSEVEQAIAAGWSGHTGFIHQVVKETVPLAELQQAEFYTCGPPPMIAAVSQMLAGECKVPPERIHYDSFF